jgi:hypothetical protein
MTLEERRQFPERTGTIVGVVRDAETGEPLRGVEVYVLYFGDFTNERGEFSISHLDPGRVELTASRRDMVEATVVTNVVAAKEARVDFTMVRTPNPCCTLEGTWFVELVLEEPGRSPARSGAQAQGTLVFSRETPDPLRFAGAGPPSDDPTLDEFGVYDIDLRPILGPDIPIFSTTIAPGNADSDILTEAGGYVHHTNQLEITLIPRMSHGGLSLTGTISGDQASGRWEERGHRPGVPTVTGRFTMRRTKR